MGLQNFSSCEIENVPIEQLTHLPSSHPALLIVFLIVGLGSLSDVTIY